MARTLAFAAAVSAVLYLASWGLIQLVGPLVGAG